MSLNQQDLLELAQQLPLLRFDTAMDCSWPQTDLAQAYLNEYGINFSSEFAFASHGLAYGFGCVASAGFRIATHYWLPQNPKGTLVIVHGYYDHVGLFKHPIRFALEHNFAVLAFDLPGHGLSDGEPATIDSFDQYGDVLADILQQSAIIMPQPFYAIGQSTGCAILLNYLWRYAIDENSRQQLSKIALCSPLVLPCGWRGREMGKITYAVLRHFVQRISRKFSQNSHDKRFLEFIQRDDLLQTRYLSLRWIGAMKQWHHTFLQLFPLQKNILVVQGTGDMTVDWRYNVPLIKRKLPNADIVYVADAGHQLVNESDSYRREVFLAIERYFFN